MKILLSANNYPTPEYPLQAFIGVLCEELTRQGHDVTVIAPVSVLSFIKHGIKMPKREFDVEVQTTVGIKTIHVHRPRVLGPGEGRFIKITSWLTQKVLSRYAKRLGIDFDIVYCHFWSSALNLKSYLEKTQIPLFVVSGEDDIHLKYLRNGSIVAYLNQRTKGVICVSSKNRDESVAKGLTDADKCIVLPNAINEKEFYVMDKAKARQELGFSEDDFIVAFCGRFNHRKGIQRVSAAITKCNDEKIKSIFIGKPVEGAPCFPDCKGILFQGTLPHEKIVTYLNAADVYALPTLAEGCSNSIVEAMACGLPIISSDLPFNWDVLDDTNSIMRNPMDVDAIANAIQRLKDNPDLRAKMSASSVNKMKDLTIERRVSKIVKYIESKL